MTIVKTMLNINPTLIAITILTLSVMAAMVIFKASLSSWLSFVLILTFSSGMMTLFIYAASMSPNEKMKTSKIHLSVLPLVLLIILPPHNNMKTFKSSMTTFSNQQTIMIMTVTLMLTMVTITSHGFNPNQSISTSF